MKGYSYLRGVATLILDPERCNGCGTCAEVCPHDVFAVGDGAAEVTNRDLCMECGACALNCPAGAVSVQPGVGCAADVIQSWFGGADKGGPCCS